MSLDDRLKSELDRSSRIVDPDVRRDLSTVRRKARRVVLRQRVIRTVAAAALIALAVFLGPKIVDVVREQRQRPAVPPSTSGLVGSYQADLTGSGEPLDSAGLAGTWTMSLQADGRVSWVAPPGRGLFEAEPSDTYQVADGQIVTSMFVGSVCAGKGVGTYSWTVSGSALSLVPVSDDCAIRRAVLASAPWTTVP
jgi:hypothetical protein